MCNLSTCLRPTVNLRLLPVKHSSSSRGQACLNILVRPWWPSPFPGRVNKLGKPCWLNSLLKIQRCDHNWGMCSRRHKPSPCEAQRDSLSLGLNLSVSPHPHSNQSGARGLMESRHNMLSWPSVSAQLCHKTPWAVGVSLFIECNLLNYNLSKI